MRKLFLLATSGLLLIALCNPAAALNAGGVLEDVQIHGFVSQGYLLSDEYNYVVDRSKDGSFEYNEFGINFSKNLTDKLRVGMQLFSRDLGDIANNKITLDWAYGDYHWKEWLGVRAGKIKLPVGLYNEIRDLDMLRTSIVMPQGIYSDLLRDSGIALNGAGIYGNIDVGAAGNIGYQMIAGSLNLDTDAVRKIVAGQGMGTLRDDLDTDTSYCGAVRWDTPLSGLRFGYSAFSIESVTPLTLSTPLGPMDVDSEAETLVQVFSTEYTWNDLIVAFEYSTTASDTTALGVSSSTDSLTYYVSASYRFSDLFTLGAYYSVIYPNEDDKDGDNYVALGLPDHRAWQKDLALTLRFDINDYWVAKIEGHYVNGTADVLAADNAGANFSEENWYYGAAKMTFSF